MLITELHFAAKPACDYSALKGRVEELLGEEVDLPDSGGAHLIFHRNHCVEYEEGSLPAQTAILMSDQPPDLESYQGDIEQSWRCKNAAELLSGVGYSCVVSEMLSRSLSPALRVRLYHGVLQAMVETTKPQALVFKNSQQVIDPADYLAACAKPPFQRPGSLNVRLFNISNAAGDMVMDTRGLEEIGLHDLQCHFRDLDPKDVGQILYNTAFYIFEAGAVIESGQTVSGIEEDARWRCNFEEALVAPKRALLDLDPGPPHNAGNRA